MICNWWLWRCISSHDKPFLVCIRMHSTWWTVELSSEGHFEFMQLSRVVMILHQSSASCCRPPKKEAIQEHICNHVVMNDQMSWSFWPRKSEIFRDTNAGLVLSTGGVLEWEMRGRAQGRDGEGCHIHAQFASALDCQHHRHTVASECFGRALRCQHIASNRFAFNKSTSCLF